MPKSFCEMYINTIQKDMKCLRDNVLKIIKKIAAANTQGNIILDEANILKYWLPTPKNWYLKHDRLISVYVFMSPDLWLL